MARDMTDRQFLEALKRNNFTRPVLFWCCDKLNDSHNYSIICTRQGKIMKRATIAHLLASRQRTEARKQAKAA